MYLTVVCLLDRFCNIIEERIKSSSAPCYSVFRFYKAWSFSVKFRQWTIIRFLQYGIVCASWRGSICKRLNRFTIQNFFQLNFDTTLPPWSRMKIGARSARIISARVSVFLAKLFCCNCENPNYSDVGKARDILARWIREINNYAAQSDIDFLLRIKMSDIASNLNFEYNNQPLELVRRVKNVLETELRVIAEAQVRLSARLSALFGQKRTTYDRWTLYL